MGNSLIKRCGNLQYEQFILNGKSLWTIITDMHWTITSQTTKPAYTRWIHRCWEITPLVLKHLLEIMWLWSYLIWQNRKCIKEGMWGRKAGQFCAHSSANAHKRAILVNDAALVKWLWGLCKRISACCSCS